MQPDHDHQPSDRKYAKKLIKLAKKHPEYYSKEEVRFAKRMKKLLKKNLQLKRLQAVILNKHQVKKPLQSQTQNLNNQKMTLVIYFLNLRIRRL